MDSELYRKRTDAEAVHTAKQCGVDLFSSIGDVLHRDDLQKIQQALGWTDNLVDCLFEPTELECKKY